MKKLFFCLLLIPFLNPLPGQTFTDVTLQSGISIPASLGDVAAWLDVNNDGWPDFYGGTSDGPFLYKNNGDGTFTDILAQSGLTGTTPRAIAVADYDKDGFDDLLVTSLYMGDPLMIYKNTGGNSFTGIPFTTFTASRAIWLDYNGDGWIDIFANTGINALLYKNNGDGTLTNMTGWMSFNQNSGTTAAATDFDNDGLQDIYCTSSGNLHTNRLYANEAWEDFTDITFASGSQDYRNGCAQAWGDYNDDGWMDLYIGNISSNRNVFFRNDADGTFTDVTLAAGVPDAGDARTCSWVDYDNDGLLDLFATNHVNPNKLYRNNGNGTFTDQATAAGIDGPSDGFSASWSDYDRDGDPDVLIAGHSYGAALLRNEAGNTNNYLNIRLVGSYDNRNGIGCRLTIYYGNQVKTREIDGGSGSVSQDELSVRLGLGSATMADSIFVRWPGGMIQKVYGIDANQFITIYQQGNVPPAVFRLSEPLPATINPGPFIIFRWESSHDPDSGNAIAYSLHIANTLHDTLIGPLADTFAVVQAVTWMEDDSTTWHVVASDGSCTRESWERWPLQYSAPASINWPGQVRQALEIHSAAFLPSQHLLSITTDLPRNTRVRLLLSDATGKTVFSCSDLPLAKGRQTLRLGVPELGAGLYFLRIAGDQHAGVLKLIHP